MFRNQISSVSLLFLFIYYLFFICSVSPIEVWYYGIHSRYVSYKYLRINKNSESSFFLFFLIGVKTLPHFAVPSTCIKCGASHYVPTVSSIFIV